MTFTFRDPRIAILEAEYTRVTAAFDAILDSLTPAQGTAAPADGWSPAQLVYHVSKVQHWVTGQLLAGAAALPPMSTVPPGPAPANLLTLLDAFPVRDRSRKVQAPEGIRPPAGLVLAEERARWVAGRTALVEALHRIGPSLTNVRVEHPALGPLSGWQWALFVSQHEERHLAQLREVLGAVD